MDNLQLKKTKTEYNEAVNAMPDMHVAYISTTKEVIYQNNEEED